MDYIRAALSHFCRADIDTGEGWNRKCKLIFSNCHQNGCGSCYGVGHGIITGKQSEMADIGQKSWIFLILSGCATGLSWLFYYKALQTGEASKVIPIDKFSVVISMVLAFVVLREAVNAKTVIGGLLITAGTFIMVL